MRTSPSPLRSLSGALVAGAILLVPLLGPFFSRWLAGRRRQRLAADLSERHPEPVLVLAADGTVLYANPATARLLDRLGGAQAGALLPSGYPDRLAALSRGPESLHTWTHQPAAGVALECRVHWLPDLRRFHVHVCDVSERCRAEEEGIRHAYHDPVTDLPNRRHFEETIGATLHAPRRTKPRTAVLLVGLDRFNVVMDSLGHAAADALLKATALRLAETLPQHPDPAAGGVLYHFGDELFCVLIPAYELEEVPVLLGEKLLEALRRPFYVAGRELNPGASIGIAVFPQDGPDGPALLRNAEAARQQARRQGGDRLQFYTPDMNERAEEWLQLENELRHAEELGEFRLLYHPQLDVASGRVIGMEALLRWQHPRRGLLSPDQFLHLAEESGLIARIGHWTLRNACAQARRWAAEGVEGLVVAVNVSARQFGLEALPGLVREVLRESGLDAGWLEIEITETTAMQDAPRTAAVLHELKALGVRLAVDDFGTGFSSLSYLKRFPIDKLKIDQSFIRHLPEDEEDAAIVRSVISLGHSLGLKVLAEGVESEAQLAWLRGAGCDAYQGFLAAPPLGEAEFLRFLRGRGVMRGTAAS